MDIQQIMVNSAASKVQEFVNWVKRTKPQLAEEILGDKSMYKISEVETLFNALDDTQKKDYQFFVDNEHNFITANRLGLPDASFSMPTGEPGHILKYALKVLSESSVKELENPILVPVSLEIHEVGREPTIFQQPGVGGTDFSSVIDSVLKEKIVQNIDKVRTIMFFTDGEPTKDNKNKP